MAETHSAQCGELAELARPLHARHPQYLHVFSATELSESTGFLMEAWLVKSFAFDD